MSLALNIGLLFTILTYLLNIGLVVNTRARGSVRSGFLFTYSFTIIWAIAYLIITNSNNSPYVFSPLIEPLFSGAWLVLLLAISTPPRQRFIDLLKHKYCIALIAALVFLITCLTLIKSNEVKFKILMSSLLLLNILLLVFTEQINRKSNQQRWAYRPLVLGLAALGVFHLVMFSNALLLNRIDADYLIARPYIYALVTPLFILSMKRVTDWELRVFISRDVVLHSSLLLFAGIYLVIMAFVGYVIQQMGMAWSGVFQIVFIAAALIALVYIFIADSTRKYFLTFIQKHFYANRFDYREQWLQLTEILDNPQTTDNVYQISLNGVCQSLAYKLGCYCKLNEGEFELTTNNQFNLDLSSQIELLNLGQILAKTHWIIDLTRLNNKEYQASFQQCQVDNLKQKGVEIILPIFINQQLHGVFLLSSKDSVKIELNWEVRDYLSAVASQVGSYIRLAEAREKLEENAQFAAFNRMSAFVVHDLKNVISQIDMIVSNSEKHKHNPEFIDDTFETLRHTKDRMDRMLNQLKDKQPQRHNHSNIDLIKEVKQLLIPFQNSQPQPIFETDTTEIVMNLDKERCVSVISHLVQNAIQASNADSKVWVMVRLRGNKVDIVIKDTGIGMSEDFIKDKLFKPFTTTKGNAGMGIGVYEAKTFATECGGSLNVDSQLGLGTTFTLSLPLRK